MRRSTKAQIQIGETVAVIMIFVVLMLFGLYWLSTASAASGEQQAVARDETDLLETAKLTMNLPELHCSVAGVVDATCLDKYRLITLSEQIEADPAVRELYQDRYVGSSRGSYRLSVSTITPGTPETYDVFDFTTQDASASSRTVAIPVVVLDPISETKQFAMMQLTHEVSS